MKIDKSAINLEEFTVSPRELYGETVYLINPSREGVQWNQSNKFLRSVVINEAGDIVSLSFFKFTNWGENPIHFPTPTSLNNCSIVTKIDGSLLIVSKYKGNFILRTRGTVDATVLDNGFELDIFKKKYSGIFTNYKNEQETWDFSLLFEWTSQNQKIVIDYGHEPNFILIGCISHNTGALSTQKELDHLAQLFNCPRPEYHEFSSLVELIDKVKGWNDKEGICLYSSGDQVIHKCKSLWYNSLHRLKSQFSSIDKIIDVWVTLNGPTYSKFESYVLDTLGFEIWNHSRGDISKICDAAKQVEDIISGFKQFIDNMPLDLTRKQKAEKIISSYGNTNRASFVFILLDGKSLSMEHRKKLLYQVLK